MQVVSLKKLVGKARAKEAENPEEPFWGRKYVIVIDDMLYFPVDVAIELGYNVLSHWIEERDV